MEGYTYRINVESNGNTVLPTLTRNANQTSKSMVGLSSGSRQAATGMATLNRGARAANGGLAMLKKTLISLGVFLSVGAVTKGIIGVGASFEKSMSTVAAISSSTTEELTRQKKAARDAGAATVFSANESADAMGYLAMAGFKADQQIAALPGTLNLAAAGSLGLASAADIATNILSQFGMQASKSTVVADQLAFTANSFNTNVAEIAEGMKYFGPTAKSFGISLAESNATIGLLANNGLKGSLATRTLSTALIRLSKPTKEMQTVMDSLNLSFFDSQGNYVGMAEMIGRLEKATSGLTQQQRQAAIATIFGSEAIKDINVLIAEGADRVRYWTRELEQAEGTARRVANTKLDNLTGDVKILQSVTEEFTLSLYDQLVPTLRSLAQEATGFVRSLDAKAIGASLSSIAKGVYSLTTFLMRNADTIVTLAKGYITLRLGIVGYNKAIGIANSITGVFNKTLKLSPVGLVLGGITALASAVTLFTKRKKQATLANEGHIKSLVQERVSVNLLASELLRSTTPLERRKQIVEELRNIQPSLVKGITDERIEYGMLTQNVEAYNRAKIKEIALEKRKGELQQLQEAASEAYLLEHAAQENIDKVFNRIVDRVRADKKITAGERDRLIGILSNAENKEAIPRILEQGSSYMQKASSLDKKGINSRFFDNSTIWQITSAYSDLRKARQKHDAAEFKAEQFSIGLNRMADRMADRLAGGSGIGSSTRDETSSSIPGAASASDNIIKGGTSQRVINITVQKFQDAVNNYFNSDGSDRQSQLAAFMDAQNEAWMRLLNSANQMI